MKKGIHDIRMVYHGTINGFNDSVEVHKFGLPTLKSHLRAMMPVFNMVDADVGEIFKLYIHKYFQKYTGVDPTNLLPMNRKI